MSSLIATTLSASNPVLCLGFLDFFPYPDSLASTMAIDFLVGIAQAACLILPMYGFAASFGRFAFCPAPADTVDLIHIPLFLHGFSRRMLLLPLVMSPFASQVMMMKDMPAFDASTFNNMLDRVQSIAKALDEDLPRSPVLSHPCEEDLRRLECDGASCLSQLGASALSPDCARLIFSEEPPRPTPQPMLVPMPSPMPMPQMMRSPLDLFSGLAQRFVNSRPEMEVEISVQDGEGNEWQLSGSPPFSASLLPPEISRIFSEFPIGFAGLFAEPMRPQMAMAAERASASDHPCAAEMERCRTDHDGTTDRLVIQQCLIEHLDDLSPQCSCFVHQMAPASELAQGRSAAAPVVHALPERVERVVRITPMGMDMPHEHHMQHASCMLFMPLLVLAIALLVRRCLVLCFPSKPVFAAVVPPAASTINTVEPLTCIPIAPELKPEIKVSTETPKA
uniref:Uncharacterized protein n=3 Tax=Chrysotila carterae TaxID=13221 RepID=A0A7S4B471_CHRCT|mmetsp:Transcript_40035/g.83951  ORF Transcript_40035/g.83951 Transcript_40035/m.83951 type:complete len:450 (+) Transcript_40035:411-1760(+)